MLIPLSLILQFAGIFTGVKLLKLDVGLVGVAILTFIPTLATNFIPGLVGFAVACVAFFVTLKAFDKTAGFIHGIVVIFISMAIQAAVSSIIVPSSL